MTRRTHRNSSRFHGLAAAVALSGVAWVPVGVEADQISLGGIAVPGIEIIAVRDGELVYLVRGGERTSPLGEVGELQMEAHPAYAQAVALLDDGKPADAAGLLRNVLRGSGRDEAWVKQFASWRLVQALDAQDQGVEAAAAFAALVGIEPDPFFLSAPPTASLGNLEADDAERARDLLERAQRSARGEALAALDALVAVLDGNAPASEATEAVPADDPTGLLNAQRVDAADSAVALPATLATSDDPAVNLVRAGRFADAITLLNSQIRNDPGRLQMRTFLKGVAMLKLAEADNDRDQYLDAGLEFMRVVAMSRDASAYLGPALLEAAVVHRAIGADAVADELFEEAGFLLDEEDEPDYFRRYAELTGLN